MENLVHNATSLPGQPTRLVVALKVFPISIALLAVAGALLTTLARAQPKETLAGCVAVRSLSRYSPEAKEAVEKLESDFRRTDDACRARFADPTANPDEKKACLDAAIAKLRELDDRFPYPDAIKRLADIDGMKSRGTTLRGFIEAVELPPNLYRNPGVVAIVKDIRSERLPSIRRGKPTLVIKARDKETLGEIADLSIRLQTERGELRCTGLPELPLGKARIYWNESEHSYGPFEISIEEKDTCIEIGNGELNQGCTLHLNNQEQDAPEGKSIYAGYVYDSAKRQAAMPAEISFCSVHKCLPFYSGLAALAAGGVASLVFLPWSNDVYDKSRAQCTSGQATEQCTSNALRLNDQANNLRYAYWASLGTAAVGAAVMLWGYVASPEDDGKQVSSAGFRLTPPVPVITSAGGGLLVTGHY